MLVAGQAGGVIHSTTGQGALHPWVTANVCHYYAGSK